MVDETIDTQSFTVEVSIEKPRKNSNDEWKFMSLEWKARTIKKNVHKEYQKIMEEYLLSSI